MIVMTRMLEDCRIELMKQMDTYVRDTIGDDEILGLWLEEGLPDGYNEADLMEIALDDEVWFWIIDTFRRCCNLEKKLK